MMGPRQEAQPALFYEFSLEDHVPQWWSREFGPAFKVDRMMKETIYNGKEKEPLA